MEDEGHLGMLYGEASRISSGQREACLEMFIVDAEESAGV